MSNEDRPTSTEQQTKVTKTPKMGRAARRRKAKTKSIDTALQALLRGDIIQDDDASLHLPTDRSQPLQGVIQRRKENQVEFDKDEKLLVSQLGYMPGNAVGVVGRTRHLEQLYPCLYKVLQKLALKRSENDEGLPNDDFGSAPTALKLYPLAIRNVHKGGKSGRKFKSRKRGHDEMSQDGCQRDESNGNCTTSSVIEPFPTMYWLTHPILKTLLSQLELGSTDNVIRMQEKLSSLPEYIAAMKDAHTSYGKHRWELLTEEDKTDVARRKWTEAVGEVRGVAGIRKFDTVKCLHTHSAHYLAYLGSKVGNAPDQECKEMEENLVGKWALEAVEKIASALKDDESKEEEDEDQSKK